MPQTKDDAHIKFKRPGKILAGGKCSVIKKCFNVIKKKNHSQAV